MNPKNYLLIFILASGCIALGQGTAHQDTVAVNKLLGDSKALIGSDSAKAIDLALQAKEMAEGLKYAKGEANALKNIGMVYYQRGIYVQTLDYWTQALHVFEGMKNDVGIANMLGNIGAIYFNQGADDKALEYSLKSLQLAEKIGDTGRMIYTLGNIGGIYHNKKDPVALSYLLKAIPLAERSGNIDAYIVLTGNIGEIYFDNGNNEKAFEYYQKSIKAGDKSSEVAFAYNGLGKVYLKEGNFEMALQNHNKALTIAEGIDEKFQVTRSLRGIADVYEKQNKISLALEYYEKARAVAEKMDNVKVELKDLYNDMSDAYANNKDFRNAYRYESLYSGIKDSIYNLETKKKLNQLQFDFDLSKKEQELVLKEARIKSEKQARILITIGLSLLLIIAFIIYRSYLQKLRHRASDLEMQALRAQMNPHFIFNSLNSINLFILKKEGSAASEYLTKFSKLMRMILNSSASSSVSLAEDLEALNLYLELERLRCEEKFSFKIQCDPELDSDFVQVPPMLLQPFVENAIWHGLVNKEGEGHLLINVTPEDSHIICSITDDGIGRSKAAELKDGSSKHKSMGMKITENRIAIMQKMQRGRKSVEIKDLIDQDGSAAGTQVVLTIPVIQDA